MEPGVLGSEIRLWAPVPEIRTGVSGFEVQIEGTCVRGLTEGTWFVVRSGNHGSVIRESGQLGPWLGRVVS